MMKRRIWEFSIVLVVAVDNGRKEVEDVGKDGEASHEEGEDCQRFQLVWQPLDGNPGVVIDVDVDYTIFVLFSLSLW